MFEDIVFSNDFIDIIDDDNQFYIKVKQQGYSMNQLDDDVKKLPRLKVNQFVAIQSAIKTGSSKVLLLGNKKPLIDLDISKDRLEASITINATKEQMNHIGIQDLMQQVLDVMKQAGIVYGFDVKDILERICPMEKTVIAKGLLPVKGQDAVVTYYKIEEAKPEIHQNGDVNHYELNLINKVHRGDWLGERIEPKDGVDGKTILGEPIPALKGNQEPFKYDKKTVTESYDSEQDKTILLASTTGAVIIENDVISVCNYLEIEGKVSFKTGNVDFDGFVDIRDVVEDNFSVLANQDIQIMGDMGIGGVNQIESKEGSIYIRGGIAGKGKAKIICEGDLYTKFATDCDIECGGTVHIGFYAINANIKAKEVIFDSYNSKVIGGSIEAQVRVQVGTVGNKMDTPTFIQVLGFMRDKVKEEYDFINVTIERVKEKINLLKQKKSLLEMVAASDLEKRKELDKVNEEFGYFKKNLKMLYASQKKTISYLRSKGEGEVVITHGIYSKVQIKIKDDVMWHMEVDLSPVTYYTDGRNILKA
ncbi:MAG: hypothetical protein CVU95_09030 [Firmicutes bacterium HGW-Firmicutes-2]|nr:MAG: hypothetical protein CVU95_09030 [Firmicutes bacterium HGW-Firmicutes-2]